MNKVKCLHCETEITSEHRHDMKWCACGHVAVDGGDAYTRRAWNGRPNWIEYANGVGLHALLDPRYKDLVNEPEYARNAEEHPTRK